jgi:hypothetical protein
MPAVEKCKSHFDALFGDARACLTASATGLRGEVGWFSAKGQFRGGGVARGRDGGRLS